MLGFGGGVSRRLLGRPLECQQLWCWDRNGGQSAQCGKTSPLFVLLCLLDHQDQDAWGNPGTNGSCFNGPKVCQFNDKSAQRANWVCQGIFICPFFDMKLLDRCTCFAGDRDGSQLRDEWFQLEAKQRIAQEHSVVYQSARYETRSPYCHHTGINLSP
jgi:hypothetical protein